MTMFKDTKIIFYINRDNECTKSFSQNKNILEIWKLLNSLCTCDQSVLHKVTGVFVILILPVW